MTSMDDVAQSVDHLFSQAGPDASGHVHAALGEAQFMMAGFDALTSGVDSEPSQFIRERLARVAALLGEAAAEMAGLEQDVNALFVRWGVGHQVAFGPVRMVVVRHTSAVDAAVVVRPPVASAGDVGGDNGELSDQRHRLYDSFPWLAPSHMQAAHYVEEDVRKATADTPEEIGRAVRQIAERKTAGSRLDMVIGLAAASAYVGAREGIPVYRQLSRNPAVVDAARARLLGIAGTLCINADQPLPPAVLERAGVSAAEVEAGLYGEHLMAHRMPDPPLDVFILATDVVVRNEVSVLPHANPGSWVGVAPGAAIPVVVPHPGNTGGGPWHARSPQERAVRIQEITDALRIHVERRFGIQAADEALVGFLAECAIAERIGHTGTPDMLRRALAGRINSGYERLTPAQKSQVAPLYRKLWVWQRRSIQP